MLITHEADRDLHKDRIDRWKAIANNLNQKIRRFDKELDQAHLSPGEERKIRGILNRGIKNK